MNTKRLKHKAFAGLTLMTLPPERKVPRVEFGDWKFKWATATELKQLISSGWKIVSDYKRKLLGV